MEKICHSESNNGNKEEQMLFQLRSRKSTATELEKKKKKVTQFALWTGSNLRHCKTERSWKQEVQEWSKFYLRSMERFSVIQVGYRLHFHSLAVRN